MRLRNISYESSGCVPVPVLVRNLAATVLQPSNCCLRRRSSCFRPTDRALTEVDTTWRLRFLTVIGDTRIHEYHLAPEEISILS